MLDGVIFDMDGVMFDTERIWDTVWVPILESLGVERPAEVLDDLRGTSGRSMEAVIERADLKIAVFREGKSLFYAYMPGVSGLQDMEDGKIDLCIDHHISNKFFAKSTFLDARASAAALIFYEYFKTIGYKISDHIALCLYTAIATDTGCFKYQNTIPEAHMAAADLMQYNIGFETINRKMFDVKSKGRIKVEQRVISNMEYYFNDRCTMIVITTELMNSCGAEPAEFEGLASIPLEIEGVVIGITVKQRHENVFKLSVRTTEEVDASAFCKRFGGGGHIRAAGCEIQGTLQQVREQVIKAVAEALGEEYDG